MTIQSEPVKVVENVYNIIVDWETDQDIMLFDKFKTNSGAVLKVIGRYMLPGKTKRMQFGLLHTNPDKFPLKDHEFCQGIEIIHIIRMPRVEGEDDGN